MTTRFDLPGGATGYVESSFTVPLVSVVVALRVGAMTDPVGKEGLCRFVARMLRRGAGGMTTAELAAAIEGLGAELSVDVGPSSVMFHGQVIRRNLEPFVALLARILGQPAFAEDEIARLRRESLAELIELRDSDRALASAAFRRALFGEHPYARAASGTTATVTSFERSDILERYAKLFVRGNVLVGLAGAVTEDEAKQLGAQLTSALPEGPRMHVEVPEPTRRAGRHLVFVDKPERTQTQAILGTLGTSAHDEDHFPLIVATAVLGGTFTSRMMREIRSKRGWSYGTSARLSVDRRRHAFAMSAAPGSSDCAPCIELEFELLEEFVQKGIMKRELGFIKNYLVRSHAFEIDTAPKRLGQFIESELLELPPGYHANYIDHVRGVTLESANAAVARRISSEDVVIIVVGTASETLPAIEKRIAKLASTTVIPFDAEGAVL